MESKKINQLATEMSPASSDLTIIGDPITGVSKKVTLEQISSLFASSISFYTNYASFPATGSVDTLYCAKDTNKLYIWSGSAYVETFPSQALLDTYQLRSEKGNANGYASLDGSGKVPSTQLPSYVDDIIEVANYASLPVTGETGKIYITLDNNKIYRWSGSVYVEIASNNAIWGSITGTLSNQTDLQNALNAKVPTTRTLTIDGTAYDLSADRTWNILPTGGADGQILAKASATNYDTEWIDNYTSTVKHYVKLSENMTIGTAAYIDDASGTNMIAAKASYDAESTSAQTMGLIGQTGITNDIVFLITEGLLSGVNTSTATIGDPVYLGLNGALIFGVANKPSAPNNLVYLGVVTRVSSTVGEIFVKVQNGYELQELHNVAISSVANNQGLFYESSTSLWKNKSIATVLGYTPISLTSLSASSPLSYNNTTGAFSISQASGSVNGFLSSTDWTTFNNKQNALTNPITGTGASGQIAYFNGTTTQTGSAFLTWDNTDAILSTNSIYNFNNTTNAYMLSSNGENIGSIFNVASAKWSLGYGTSTTALGTPALTWDTSGRVGIGTTSPTTRLHVAGDIQSTTGVFLANTGGYFMTLNTLNGMYIDSTNYLTLNTNGLERARINTNGTFSIGNTNNTYNLDVTGTGRFTGNVGIGYAPNTWFSGYVALEMGSGALVFPNNAINTQLWNNLYINTAGNPTYKSTGIGGLFSLGGGGNAAVWYSAPSGTAGTTASLSQIMTLTNGGNLGIGTTAPTSPLHVGTTTSGNQKIQHWGEPGFVDNYGLILRGSSLDGVFKFYGLNNGTETTNPILSMNRSSGNVGIGTTSPFSQGTSPTSLEIAGANFGQLFVSANSGAIRGTLMARNGTSDVYIGAITNSPLAFGTNDTERMRITSVGNVGIGTSSPTNYSGYTTLSINNATNGGLIDLQYNGTSAFRISGEATQNAVFGATNIPLVFSTNSIERMRITSGGAVLVGKTTKSTFTSATTIEVSGEFVADGSNAGVFFENRASTGTIYGWYGVSNAIYLYNSAVGNIGLFAPSNGGYTALSDINKKKDFEDSTIGLNAILGLKPTLYRMKSDSNDVPKQLGFIAQEVKEFIPQAYVEQNDFIGLNDRPIIAALVKAVQELKAEIDELKNK